MSATRTSTAESAAASSADSRRDTARLRPWRSAALGIFALFVIALTAPLAVAALPMMQGRDAVEQARAALTAGDVAAAGTHLELAERRFRVARLALRNPFGWLGGAVPVLGRTQRSAAELALAGELVARGGAGVVTAVDELPDGVRSLMPSQGAVPVEAIRSLEPDLADAVADVTRAQAAVASAPESFVLAPVAEARRQLEAELAELGPGLQNAHSLVEVVPGFLGADEPRRYFFGASQVAELRGAGGFIGAFSIMTADEGRLSFEEFRTIHELPDPAPGSITPPSPEVESRYARYGGIERWNNVSISADFPTVGALVERLYGASTGETLDGVIVADPFALAELLRVAGPATVPGYGPVDHDTVVPFVANEAFAHFETQAERQGVLGAVAAGALKGFLEDGGDRAQAAGAVSALGRATRAGHLRLYAARSHEQAAFEAVGAAGSLSPVAGDLVDVSVNSSSNAKVDYFLEPALDYRVWLRPEGGAHGHATVRFTNAAPSDTQPTYVIGPAQEGFTAGDNRFFATIACAAGCSFDGFSRDGQTDSRVAFDQDAGHELLTTPVELASGAEQTIEARWQTPSGTWEADGGELTYRLTLRTPSSVTPTDVTVAVNVPEGMRVERAPGMEQRGSEVVFKGPVRGSHTVELTFSDSRAGRPVADFLGRLRPSVEAGNQP